MKAIIAILLIMTTFSFSDEVDSVRLKAFGNEPMVIGRVVGTETQSYLIPNNTRAVVLEWSQEYKQKKLNSQHKDLISYYYSKVKILNGPLKGTVVLINHIYIFLE